MTIKELIKTDFGVDLPISGGFGNSIDNPIIIHKEGINDYVGTEYFILKCLGKGRRIEWKILEQALLTHNNKKIDKIKIETKQTTELETITQIENYYFDITKCFEQNENLAQVRKQINKYNLIEKFFSDQDDYIIFLVGSKKKVLANNEATCIAELTKEAGCFLYILTWVKDGKYIGDYIKPFRASIDNINTFNEGCRIMAERLSIFIETGNLEMVPTNPPAFKELTEIKS
jgi:hypothetical protein